MASLTDLFKMLGNPPEPGAVPRSSNAALDLAGRFRLDVLKYIEDANEEGGGTYKNYLRSSGLHDVCGRQTAILREHPELRQRRKRNAGGVMTVDWGTMLHEWWQNRYIGPMGRLWGGWACLRCSPIVEIGGRSTLEPVHTGLMPNECPACGAPRVIGDQPIVVYHEMFVKDDTLKYSGHPDGLLAELLPDKRVLLELKSIKTDAYDALRKPKHEHSVQSHSYMRLTDTTEALVVYADKGRQCPWTVRGGRFVSGDARVKMFHLPFKDETWAEVEGRIKEHWRADAGASPRELLRICRTPSCGRARLCVARDACFRIREDGK